MSPKVTLLGDEEVGDLASPHLPRTEAEEIFDQALAEMLEEEREQEWRGQAPPRPPLPPDVAEAGEALNAMFGEDYHLTADLSFDQVFAKALPHFITIWKHFVGEQAIANPEGAPRAHGDH